MVKRLLSLGANAKIVANDGTTALIRGSFFF